MLALEPLLDGSITARNFEKLANAVNHPVPQARVYNNANISIANNTVTALTFNSERFDTGGLHDTSSDTGRLTVRVAGLYAIGLHVRFANNSTGARFASIRLNGTTDIASARPQAVNNSEISITTVWQFAANEFVDSTVLQASGGALNVEAANAYSPEFWIVRLAGFANVGLT